MTVASRTWFSDFSYLLVSMIHLLESEDQDKKIFFSGLLGVFNFEPMPSTLGTLCAQVPSATRWGASISRAALVGWGSCLLPATWNDARHPYEDH